MSAYQNGRGINNTVLFCFERKHSSRMEGFSSLCGVTHDEFNLIMDLKKVLNIRPELTFKPVFCLNPY